MYSLALRPNRRTLSAVFDRDFDKFFENITQAETQFTPACEVRDIEQYFTISLDIPGIKKEEIDLEVKENELHISGERKFAKNEKDNVVRSERRYGKFSRVFTLPQNVKADAIEARFEDGVLEIVLPKEEKAQTRKITISGKSDTPAMNN